MAFVSTGWKFSVTLMDVGYQTTTKTYDLVSADATEAAADSAAILTALGNVTDLEVISHHYYEKFEEDTVVNSTAQKENQGLLTFEIDGAPTKHATHSIPGVKNALFVSASGPNNNVINTLNAAVVAYAGLFITGAGQKATISDGESAAALTDGRRRHVGNSRG